MSEAVEVTADVSLLENDSSQRGQVITHEQAVALPLNGREYSSLVLLSTGVRLSALNTGSASTVREGSFNVNGLRSTFNNFLLDGLDNNAYGTSNQGFSNQVMQPSPDAVAEFMVVTNNMSAEYGRSAGATVNVAYASGTNEFRGAAWEFLRDERLNATGFFKPVTGEKPPLTRNQFGFVFGGPIIRNRAFFFVDYEGFRQTRENVAFSTIPNPRQRSGILGVDVRDPRTGALYPAGTPIPMTPFAAEVLSGLPDPTSSNAANNYQILQQFSNHNDKYSAKFDVQLTPKTRGFARIGYRDVNLVDQPPIPLPSGGGGNGDTYVQNLQIATGAHLGPSDDQLFEFRFGVSRTKAGKNPLALGQPRRGGGLRHQRPAHRPPRVGRPAAAGHPRVHRPRPPGDQPPVAVPDRVQPEDQLHAVHGAPLAEDGPRVPARPHRGAGREPALRPRRVQRPVHPAGRQHQHLQRLQPRRLHARPAQPLRPHQLLHREPAPEPLLRVRAGRLQGEPAAHPEPRAALRIRDPAVGDRKQPHQLRPRDAHDGGRPRRLHRRPRAGEPRPQQLRPAPRLRLLGRREDRRPRRVRRELHPLPPRGRRERAADQRPPGHQRRHQPDARRRHLRAHRRRLSRRASPTPPGSAPRWPTSPSCPPTTRRARCRAGSSPCSARCCATSWSTSPTSATRRTTCCCSRTTTRRGPTTPARA